MINLYPDFQIFILDSKSSIDQTNTKNQLK